MEIKLQVVYAIVAVAVAIGALCSGVGFKKKKKLMTILGCACMICSAFIGGLSVYMQKNAASYEVGAYPDEEKHYLVTDIQKDGTVSYIDANDFTVKTAKVDLTKALISGRIPTIGLNNRYKKYFQVGNYKIWWDSYEDTMILSKYDAIQLGFIKATGAEDEKQFKIATSSEAIEELQKEQEASQSK